MRPEAAVRHSLPSTGPDRAPPHRRGDGPIEPYERARLRAPGPRGLAAIAAVALVAVVAGLVVPGARPARAQDPAPAAGPGPVRLRAAWIGLDERGEPGLIAALDAGPIAPPSPGAPTAVADDVPVVHPGARVSPWRRLLEMPRRPVRPLRELAVWKGLRPGFVHRRPIRERRGFAYDVVAIAPFHVVLDGGPAANGALTPPISAGGGHRALLRDGLAVRGVHDCHHGTSLVLETAIDAGRHAGAVDDFAWWRGHAHAVLRASYPTVTGADDGVERRGAPRRSAVALLTVAPDRTPEARALLRGYLEQVRWGPPSSHEGGTPPTLGEIDAARALADDPDVADAEVTLGPEVAAFYAALDPGGSAEVAFWRTVALGTSEPGLLERALRELGEDRLAFDAALRARVESAIAEGVLADRALPPLVRVAPAPPEPIDPVGAALAAGAWLAHILAGLVCVVAFRLSRRGATATPARAIELARALLIVGLVIVFFDLRIHGVDLLPDAAGFIIAALGTRALARARIRGVRPLGRRWAGVVLLAGAFAVALEHVAGTDPWAGVLSSLLGVAWLIFGLAPALRRLFRAGGRLLWANLTVAFIVLAVIVYGGGLLAPPELLRPPDAIDVPRFAQMPATLGVALFGYLPPALLLVLLLATTGRVVSEIEEGQRLAAEAVVRREGLGVDPEGDFGEG